MLNEFNCMKTREHNRLTLRNRFLHANLFAQLVISSRFLTRLNKPQSKIILWVYGFELFVKWVSNMGSCRLGKKARKVKKFERFASFSAQCSLSKLKVASPDLSKSLNIANIRMEKREMKINKNTSKTWFKSIIIPFFQLNDLDSKLSASFRALFRANEFKFGISINIQHFGYFDWNVCVQLQNKNRLNFWMNLSLWQQHWRSNKESSTSDALELERAFDAAHAIKVEPVQSMLSWIANVSLWA